MAITPQQAKQKKPTVIPDEIIKVFDELIVQNYVKGKSTVYLRDALKAAANRMKVGEQEILNNRWMDVEEAYSAAGWKVTYESPRYADENFNPYFTFTSSNDKEIKK